MNHPSALGVTFGYLGAAAIAATLWIGVGVILLPVMLVLAAAHALAAPRRLDLAGAHHRWLTAHHLWSVIALILILIAPLAVLPTFLTDAMTVINTLAYAPHPFDTLAVAWPDLDHWQTLAVASMILVCGRFAVTFWISFRLLRRGLRWAEGAPAH